MKAMNFKTAILLNKITLILFLLSLIPSVGFAGTDKKEFKIDGPDRMCGRGLATYSTSYSVARVISWEITGGEIVEINGLGIPEFYTEYMNGESLPDGPIVKFEYNTLGSGSVTVMVGGQESTVELSVEIFYALLANPANTITVDWTSHLYSTSTGLSTLGIVYTNPGTLIAHGRGLGEFGVDGAGVYTKSTFFDSALPTNFNLAASQTNLTCNQGIQISGAPNGGVSYNWNTSGGVIQNGGNWNTGIQISNFTRDGIIPITVTVSNQCNSVTKTISLNVTQPDFGHVTQNGTDVVDVPGSLVSLDCQGGFNLGMPWVSNNAIYTWELPGVGYNDQTNIYDKKIISGLNKLNVQGKLPENGLTDFVGKVTITGVCGAPVVRTFIIRPTLRPSVDADIYSCSNSVVIKVNNPTGGTNNINAWVASTTPNGGWGSFVNATPTSVQFTASNPGDFNININIYGARGCFTQLHTTFHAVSASPNTPAGTAGWQSGVLSDNRKAPGSNIVAYGGNIYFAGRDSKIYYYSYSTALQKWVINQLPGITNAAIPVAGSFTKIGLVTIGTDNYLLYTDNIGLIKKINLATNIVDNAFGVQILSSEFIASGFDLYAIEKSTNKLYSITGQTPFTLINATLKAIIPGYGIMYIQNNNLYSTWYGQLTYTGDVYVSSDMVYYNGQVYFARGQKGSANLYRVPMPNPNQVEQITTSANLSGIFNINPASSVIYYGVFASQNTVATVASGGYKFSNIYQAHLLGTTWIFNAATQVKSPEGFDMLIQSPIYSGNHLYYIGAGHNGVIGNGLELEVWNLYYENACAPTLQRIAADDTNLETSTEVLLYPNPFNTELSIDLSAYTEDGNLTPVDIEVIDATGKTIYEENALSELTTIPTADWAQGVYVVKIKHNNKVANKKIVKY